jgi:hypothetical protein
MDEALFWLLLLPLPVPVVVPGAPVEVAIGWSVPVAPAVVEVLAEISCRTAMCS